MTTYNLATLLETSADELPRAGGDRVPRHRPADDVRRGQHVRQHGRGLPGDKGIQPGDKVALSCPNLPYFSIIYWGILKAGATVVPLNVLLKGREVAYHLGDSDAKAFFCFEGTAELPIGAGGLRRLPGRRRLRDLRRDHRRPRRRVAVRGHRDPGGASAARTAPSRPSQTDEDDTAVILYTSGTTGQPKGAELRHRNMRDNALLGEELFGADAGEPRHVPVRAAAVPLLRPDRHPERLRGVRRHRGDAAALRARPGARADADRGRSPSSPASRPCTGACSARSRRQRRRRARSSDNLRVAVAGGLGAAGRGAQGLRGEVRRHHPRGLRPLRDLAGRHLHAGTARTSGSAPSACPSPASR